MERLKDGRVKVNDTITLSAQDARNVYDFIKHEYTELDIMSMIAKRFSIEEEDVADMIPNKLIERTIAVYEKAKSMNDDWADHADYAISEMFDELQAAVNEYTNRKKKG